MFSRLVNQYLTDEEYGELQLVLMTDTEAGDLIPDSGGVRKIRWGAKGRGKRGGLRVIYYAWVRGSHLDADPLSEKCDGEHSWADA